MQYERRWIAVTAIGLSLFLSALDATIVALALPPIAQHFQLSDSLVSAVTLSYAIPLTLLLQFKRSASPTRADSPAPTLAKHSIGARRRRLARPPRRVGAPELRR